MLRRLGENWILIVLASVFIYFVGRYFYRQPNAVNGSLSPNFSGLLLNGDSFHLSSLRGSYVLLDFWGSWCAPCIEEAPQLKRLHNQFYGKKFQDAQNFHIVGIGVETDRARWVRAVEGLGLNWQNHISDFQSLNSTVLKQYGVRVIPTKILLNPSGIIVGVNPSFEEIEKKLTEKLAD
jgi:thiol-disulfide isomerase/thioredoxin